MARLKYNRKLHKDLDLLVSVDGYISPGSRDWEEAQEIEKYRKTDYKEQQLTRDIDHLILGAEAGYAAAEAIRRRDKEKERIEAEIAAEMAERQRQREKLRKDHGGSPRLQEWDELHPEKKHVPIKPPRPKEGVDGLPGNENLKPMKTYVYKEPWDLQLHFSPEVRENRRKKYNELQELEGDDSRTAKHRKRELERDLFGDKSQVWMQFKALATQAMTYVIYWENWLDLAAETLAWYKADLEGELPFPDWIKHNILRRRQERDRRIRFYEGEKPPPPDQKGHFSISPPKPLFVDEDDNKVEVKKIEQREDEDGTIRVGDPRELRKLKEREKMGEWIEELE